MNKDQNFSLSPGTLYVVALPIGNLKDISEHAKTVLSLVDYTAAEDTRTFKELSLKLHIDSKNLLSYHEHNEKGSAPELLRFLQQGKTIAIVSDAGTPNVSDPGFQILKLCFENGIPVVGIPGPSSLTYALSVCPIGGKSHYFGAFPPSASKERILEFKEKSTVADRIVFFESPHRLIEHLEDAKTVFQGSCLVLRELTKTYEEILYKPISEMIAHFETKKPQGEFVIVYPGQEKSLMSLEDLKDELTNLVRENLKPSDILKRVQDLTSLTRRQLYDLITEIKHGLKKD
jgi:16S rRNA (cytidine1402-2'-O)-methyltransferase